MHKNILSKWYSWCFKSISNWLHCLSNGNNRNSSTVTTSWRNILFKNEGTTMPNTIFNLKYKKQSKMSNLMQLAKLLLIDEVLFLAKLAYLLMTSYSTYLCIQNQIGLKLSTTVSMHLPSRTISRYHLSSVKFISIHLCINAGVLSIRKCKSESKWWPKTQGVWHLDSWNWWWNI